MIPLSMAFVCMCICPGLTSNSQITKLIVCAGFLMLASPVLPSRPTLTRCLVVAWLVWATIGCVMSDNWQIAIYGFHLRYEGLCTYVLAVIGASLFWRQPRIMWIVGLLAFVASAFTVMDLAMPTILINWIGIPNIAQAALFSVAAVIMYGIQRPFALICVPPLIWTANRSAIFAVCAGIAVIEALRWNRASRSKVALWLVLAVVGCVVAMVSPIRKRLEATGATLTGARIQWMMQADTIARHHLPLFGLGLDTESKWLKPPKSGYYEREVGRDTICDRTHNLGFDMILQTGWVGYTLALLALGAAAAVTVKHRSPVNVTCLAGLVAFVAFGMLNPLGVPALVLAVGCLWGIKEEDDK